MVIAFPIPVHEHSISVMIHTLAFLFQDKLVIPTFVCCVSYVASRLVKRVSVVLEQSGNGKLENSGLGQARTLLKREKEEHQR